MDALFTMLSRRSVRSYQPGEITQEQIDNLLKAAMAAPSAGNSQPWHFVVVNEREKLTQISVIHPHAKMADQAKLAIMVCADPTLEKYTDFWPQDCAAAVQNILLAAHAQGLGAVWTGIYPAINPKVFREMFELPQNIEPFALVVVGNSSKEPQEVKRYLANRVHLNTFNSPKTGS